MVYFIQGTITGNIKIGRTKNDSGYRLERRVAQIQSSDVIKVLKVIVDEIDDKPYHRVFHNCWSHGEWFKPSKELLAFIRTIPRSKWDGMIAEQDCKAASKEKAQELSNKFIELAREFYKIS